MPALPIVEGFDVYQDEDGTVVLRGRLAPEVGALLLRALAAARETLYQQARGQEADTADASAEIPTMPQQQADALALLAETACTTGSIPAHRASGTRWWSTSMPRYWPTRISRASPSSRTGCAFPRERRSAWRATPAGW
jgi:hypothetical protein